MTRLLSIAAGTAPELARDSLRFVRCAADAGWEATGLWFEPDVWTSAVTSEVRRVLDDTGMVAVDMEVIRIGSDRDFGDQLVDAAAGVGARNILAISSLSDPQATADRLSALCERAAPAGIRVCLEFMRFTEVKTLADALAVVDLVDSGNVGVLVDLLHVVRSGTTFDEIRAADPHLFPYVQWCDGPAEPVGWSASDLITDALDARSIPGEGELATAEFERLFADAVPFSLEVRSKRLRDEFPDPTDRAAHLRERAAAALPG